MLTRKPSFVSIGIAFALLAVLLPAIAFAQLNTAKVEGTVRDADTGAPLQGAQVLIEGTRLGNVTNADGYFFILNVPPGRRDISFTFTGYQKTTVTAQLLLAGQTTTVNANLSSTVVQMEGITVQGETEVLMPRDNVGTKQRMTAEQMAESPTTKLEDLMILEAGVQTGGEGGRSRGLRIRGGRLGEEAMVVDGVTVRNYTANPHREGAFWVWTHESASLGEDTNPLEFSTGAVEEVDILTGGFQAEYGNAQSGIINIVTKTGGPKYTGAVKWITDEVNPRTADFGYNAMSVEAGGPIPAISNFYFQLSGEIQGMLDTNPTHASEGFRGFNQDFVNRLNQAVRNDPVLGAKDWWETEGFAEPRPAFTLEEMKAGREAWVSRMGNGFFEAHPWVQQGLYTPENPVRQPDNWMDRNLLNGKMTFNPTRNLKLILSDNFSRHQRTWPSETEPYFRRGWITPEMLTERTWSTAKGDIITDTDTIGYFPINVGRRTRTNQFLTGVDWDFLSTSNRSATLQFRYSNFRTQDINSSNMKDNYFHDTQFLSFNVHDIPFLVETYPGRDHARTPEDAKLYYPDGASVWSRQHNYWTPFGFTQASQLYFLNYRYQREIQHILKADIDFQLDRHNRAKFGVQSNLFDNKMFQVGQVARQLDNEFDYRPRIWALYAQNRTDLGDFVFDYGLRYDGFQPRDNWGFRNGDQYGERFFPENQSELSPRFNVAFPVTDKAQLRFSYGVFTQMPSFTFIFNGSNPGGLEYARTDAFEAGVSYLLSDDMVMDLVTYHRDADGNLAQGDYFRDYWESVTGRHVRGMAGGYVNSDRSNIKGLDLTLRKRFSEYYSFNAVYTMQFSRTTGASYIESTHDELRAMGGDRTHKLSVRLNTLTPQDVFAGTWANLAFRDFRSYLIVAIESGQPTEDLSRRRGRWDYNIDLRLTKGFDLGGTKRFSLFAEIYNLTDRKLPQPYPSGYNYQGHRYDPTGGVDLTWEDASPYQKFLFPADFNGDGILTVMEAAKGSIANSYISSTQDWASWGFARQVRSGVEIRF